MSKHQPLDTFFEVVVQFSNEDQAKARAWEILGIGIDGVEVREVVR